MEEEHKLKTPVFITLLLALLLSAGAVFGQQANDASTNAAKDRVSREGEDAKVATRNRLTLADTSNAKNANSAGRKPVPLPQPETDPENWHIEVAPYLWAAALKGDLRVRNTVANVDASFSDLFKQLDFAFATRVEFSKGKWRIIIDENYMNLGTTGVGPLGEVTDIQPTLNFFEFGGSYAPIVLANENSTANEPLPPVFSLEILGGARYTHFGLGLQRGTNPPVEGSRNLVDVFGGSRIKGRPHPQFAIIGKATIGGGGSDFAWTISGVGEYQFRKNMSFWGGYQLLDMDSDKPSNTIGFNGQLRGLIFGMTIYK
jgi:hypothetical protein